MRPSEHYRRAEELLAEGVQVVEKIALLADARPHEGQNTAWGTSYESITRRMDELGKKAMGIWAQAQVHATLATSVHNSLI